MKQNQQKCEVYFVILRIMLKSPYKAKLLKILVLRLLMLFSYNKERFNIAYAMFHLRFSETFVN